MTFITKIIFIVRVVEEDYETNKRTIIVEDADRR